MVMSLRKDQSLIFGSVMAVIAALMLSGCVPEQKGGQTTILYAFWGSVEQVRIEREVIKAFEKANPDIRVNMLPIGSRYSDKIQAMFVGNVAPDVMMLGMPHYWDWSEKGLLENVDDLLPPERARDLMPAARRGFDKEGHFYAMPVHVGAHVMFLNLKALREAGVDPDSLTSWDAVLAAAPRLSKRGDGSGTVTDFAFMIPQALSIIWSFGGKLFDDYYHPKAVTIESPETLEALKFLRKLRANPYAVPFEMLGDQGGYTLFRDGRIAIYFNGRWITPEFAGIKSFDWDVRPIPAVGKGAISHLFGGALGIWSGSKHKEAARRFVKFYTLGKGMDILMRGGRYTPVFRQAAYGKDFLSLRPPESIKAFSESMEDGRGDYPLFASSSLKVGEIVKGRIEQLYSQPSLPEEAILRGLREDLEHWLSRRHRMKAAKEAAL